MHNPSGTGGIDTNVYFRADAQSGENTECIYKRHLQPEPPVLYDDKLKRAKFFIV